MVRDFPNGKGIFVEEIEAWLGGDFSLPKNRKFDQYETSTAVKEVYKLFNRDEFSKVSERCNDHVHLNQFSTLRLSGNSLPYDIKLSLTSQFSDDFRLLFMRHIAIALSANPAYMCSSDYVDSLECDLEPAAGSQYWVAPYIQELFDKVITVYRPDITKCIKEHSYMDLK